MNTQGGRPGPWRSRSPALVAARGAGTLLLVVIAWLVLAPQSIGGNAAYLSVHGNSMANTLSNGDTAVVRRAQHYAVGDAVAVQHPTLGLVLHRIVADDGERFTLQGDNRPTVDHFRPLPEDIVGKLWIRIPYAGSLIEGLQHPHAVAALVGGVFVLGTAGLFVRGGRSRRRRTSEPGRRTSPTPARGHSLLERAALRISLQSAGGQALAGTLAVVVLAAALLLLVHQSAGTTRRETVTLAVAESGRFAYGDEVASTGVYDANRFAAPQPVYLEVVRRLPVSFEYALAPATAGEQLSDVVGAYTLSAEVVYPNGGTLTLPIQDTTLFAGPTARIQGTVELAKVLAMIAAAERQTDVTSLSYQLRIAALVEVDGSLGGVPFQRRTAQDIEFRLTEKQLQFDVKESALESEATITVGRTVTVPQTLDLPVVSASIPHTAFPPIAIAGIALAALGFSLLAFATRAVSRMGSAATIRARYGHLLVAVVGDIGVGAPTPGGVAGAVTAPRFAASSRRRRARRARARGAQQTGAEAVAPVSAPSLRAPERNVIVESFPDLARLAEQRGLAVLTTHHGHIDEYAVIDDDTTYRFATLAARPARAAATRAPDAHAGEGDETPPPLLRLVS